MKEYLGDLAKKYKQTTGKIHLLIPAITKAVPHSTNKDSKLLDIACGNADLYELATKKGYQYYGLDVSPEMVERAQQEYPNGHYLCASATDFSSQYQDKFEIILISMLFNAFTQIDELEKTFSDCAKVLKRDGKIIVGNAHPLYDGYMQLGLLGRTDDMEANFIGYFDSGGEYLASHQFEGQKYTFQDHHWPLADILNSAFKAGLLLEAIDECQPNSSTGANIEYIQKKSLFPTYIALTFVKK